MRNVITILFVLVAATLLLFQKSEGGAAELTLIPTSYVTGHLFPCPT
jgi:hypothetical protein